MTFQESSVRQPCEPLSLSQIESRLGSCTCLPSLGSIEKALKELLGADQRYTSQIAEIIRRDPSLTARLLRMVNAVHYGLSMRIRSIEEAVFYIGIRQVRQLAMVTPIIKDFQIVASQARVEWRGFWRHCIGTALMTRDILDLVQTQQSELDYVAGLIHDVGKIVMASAFPDHFAEIYIQRSEADMELSELEREVLGVDHAELGALYLRSQSLPSEYVDIVQFHHQPDKAPSHGEVAAAVQVADLLVQEGKIGYSGRLPVTKPDLWCQSTGWKMLFGNRTEEENAVSRASLKKNLERVPATLERLI